MLYYYHDIKPWTAAQVWNLKFDGLTAIIIIIVPLTIYKYNPASTTTLYHLLQTPTWEKEMLRIRATDSAGLLSRSARVSIWNWANVLTLAGVRAGWVISLRSIKCSYITRLSVYHFIKFFCLNIFSLRGQFNNSAAKGCSSNKIWENGPYHSTQTAGYRPNLNNKY